ncbi:alpha/beta fold hydrolase [Rhodococcus triatomae]|uniref:Alpha/beta hydrolase fold n=1 Tax=Rhodococcus triatomae TaxID=300028 RepID=A0A1G8GYZ9_9NOCA|nr:alpha/beta fold hydrolase [Rhodococcus triatomae]QNG20258.1 alpha/beta fold hydrolase [Rhodococcus triatomae]QNG23827.1 alpha/beta fold hydrolase [Rhodococcus triatomae]SDH99577.1 alpha/beta hydrolase fold [Rhodococcus triatomae]
MRLAHSSPRLVLTALAALTAATVTAACGSGDEPAAATEDTTTPPATSGGTSRIAYGDDPDNYGILHLPDGEGPHPVVVMVHGGGWLEDHDLSYFEPLSQSLTDEGIAVWNIEYRRVEGTGGWPTTLADADDATEALGTVVQDEAGGRLDLDDVHLAGHSAGGHLAAWIAGRHTLPPGSPGEQPSIVPRSATIMAGVFDLGLAATAGHDMFVQGLLGGTPDQYPDRYRIASPIEHLPVGLPVTAVHGTADQTVDPAQSRNYVAAATTAGDPAQLHTLDGVGHGEFGDVTSPAWAASKQIILDHVAAEDDG